MGFSVLLFIFSVFLRKFDENAIIYIFGMHKIYGNFRNLKLLKIIRIVKRIKQLVENMLYEIVFSS